MAIDGSAALEPRAAAGEGGRPAAARGNWVVRNAKGRVLIDLQPAVFGVSSLLIAAFVALSLLHLERFAGTVELVQAQIAERAGWFFVLTVNAALGYLVFLLAAPLGRIRLGGPTARPEFSRFAWLAMLFAAGMGIGLVFYAVAEPVQHLATPPRGALPGSRAAYEDAIRTTFLHWGLHAWGVYALTGLALAYFAFNRGSGLSIRAAFRPLLGARVSGWSGHAVDILATVATLFGVATSLGLGAIQVSEGVRRLAGLSATVETQVALIAIITGAATASVVLGLERGIKRLSVFNIVCAGALLAFVLLAGPTLFILNGLLENVGLYLDDFFTVALWNETYTGGSWQNGWTIFYWGWWIAWSPFVGLFIARISRGRTIREFVAGALLAATGITFVWLTVFGGSALFMELQEPGRLVAEVEANLAGSLFAFLDALPAATGAALPPEVVLAAGVLATVVIVTFFVTSSDSASLVIDMITAGGRPSPPTAQRVYWAVLEGVVAAVLLIGGGLAALQTAAIAAGLPFAVVLLLMAAGLHRALSADWRAVATAGPGPSGR